MGRCLLFLRPADGAAQEPSHQTQTRVGHGPWGQALQGGHVLGVACGQAGSAESFVGSLTSVSLAGCHGTPLQGGVAGAMAFEAG